MAPPAASEASDPLPCIANKLHIHFSAPIFLLVSNAADGNGRLTLEKSWYVVTNFDTPFRPERFLQLHRQYRIGCKLVAYTRGYFIGGIG